MASPVVMVEMDIATAKVFQGLQQIIHGQKGMEAGLGKITAASRQAAKEEEELGRQAKRVYEDTRTPAEQYNRTMEKLNTLLQRGKIDAETFGRAAKRAHDGFRPEGFDASSFLRRNVAEVKGFALGLIGGGGVVQGIEAVIEKLGEWERKQKEIGKLQEDLSLKMREAVSIPGAWLDADLIAREMTGWKGTKQEQISVFSGITGRMGGRSLKDQLAFGKAAMEASPLIPPTQAEQFGGLVGEFGKNIKDKTPDQIVGLAVAAQTQARAEAGALTGPRGRKGLAILRATGMDTEEAIGSITASIQAGSRGASGLIAAAEKAAEKYDDTKRWQLMEKATTDAKAASELELSKVPTKSRMQWMREHPEKTKDILGTTEAEDFLLVKAEDVAARVKELRASQQPGYVAGLTGGFAKTTVGKVVATQKQLSDAEQRLLAIRGPRGLRLANEQKFMELLYPTRSWGEWLTTAKSIPEWMTTGGETALETKVRRHEQTNLPFKRPLPFGGTAGSFMRLAAGGRSEFASQEEYESAKQFLESQKVLEQQLTEEQRQTAEMAKVRAAIEAQNAKQNLSGAGVTNNNSE